MNLYVNPSASFPREVSEGGGGGGGSGLRVKALHVKFQWRGSGLKSNQNFSMRSFNSEGESRLKFTLFPLCSPHLYSGVNTSFGKKISSQMVTHTTVCETKQMLGFF